MQEELRILNAQDKVRRDSFTAAHGGYQATPLHEHDTDSSAMKRLKSLLKPFYDKYDVNGNGTLDIEELHAVFKDLNEDVRQKDLAHLFEEFDTDKDQLIDFDEFVLGVAKVCVNLHCLCL
jgi:EF-hand domain pair